MHTYRKTEEGPWTTGFEYAGPRAPEWRAIADFNEEWKAAFYASFLNGGNSHPGIMRELFPGRDFVLA